MEEIIIVISGENFCDKNELIPLLAMYVSFKQWQKDTSTVSTYGKGKNRG